jgi:hypothetical protein
VQRAAHVDHAAISAAGSTHVLTIVPAWNTGDPTSVACG